MTEWLVDAHCTYQAGLDVERLAREGYAALVVKATQGAGGYWAPATFDDWIRRARAAGMITGAYHWITDSDPVAQVDYFLRRLAPVGGPDRMLIQLDCEDTASPATPATLAGWIAEWNRRTGAHPLLFYSGAWWAPHLGGLRVADIAPNLHQWDSHYVPGGGVASVLYEAVADSWWTSRYGGFDQVTVLQFSSSGHAGGLAGGVDVNAFRGGRDELAALTSTKGAVMADLTWPKSAAVGDRVAGTLLDDQWCEEHLGHSGFVETNRSYRSALLDEVRDNLRTLLDRPAATVVLTDTQAAALAADVADQVTIAINQLTIAVQALTQRVAAAGAALKG